MTFIKIILITLLVSFFSSIYAQDIIVLANGELVKSKVLEIDLTKIKYKRFDQQSGPTYSVLKEMVFAIHYEDGTKDIYGTIDQNIAAINQTFKLLLDTLSQNPETLFMDSRKIVHVGVGLQKLYSPVNEIGVDSYAAESLFWQIEAGLGLNSNLVVGFMFSQGKYSAEKTFVDQYQFSSTQFNISQKTSSFSAWARYYLQTKYSNFRPYATIGLSFNSSIVEVLISTNSNGQVVDFDRGGRIMDVFPLTRVGMELDVSKDLGLFTEVGYGLTLVNLGVQYNFTNKQ